MATHVFLDEFHNFVTPSIEDILAESRKYAVHLTLVQQFFGQKTDTQLRAGIMNNTAVKICGTGEDTSLEKMARVMTGASKEDLQNCDRGVFYVKVKRQGGIIQQAFGTNHARPLRNNISLLGFKNGMTKTEWQEVRADQLKKYYRSLKPSASHSEAEMFTPSTATPEQETMPQGENTGFLHAMKKKFLAQRLEDQKTPEWLEKHLKAEEEPKTTKPEPTDSPTSPKIATGEKKPLAGIKYYPSKIKTPQNETENTEQPIKKIGVFSALFNTQINTQINITHTSTKPPYISPVVSPPVDDRAEVKGVIEPPKQARIPPPVPEETEAPEEQAGSTENPPLQVLPAPEAPQKKKRKRRPKFDL